MIRSCQCHGKSSSQWTASPPFQHSVVFSLFACTAPRRPFTRCVSGPSVSGLVPQPNWSSPTPSLRPSACLPGPRMLFPPHHSLSCASVLVLVHLLEQARGQQLVWPAEAGWGTPAKRFQQPLHAPTWPKKIPGRHSSSSVSHFPAKVLSARQRHPGVWGSLTQAVAVPQRWEVELHVVCIQASLPSAGLACVMAPQSVLGGHGVAFEGGNMTIEQNQSIAICCDASKRRKKCVSEFVILGISFNACAYHVQHSPNQFQNQVRPHFHP